MRPCGRERGDYAACELERLHRGPCRYVISVPKWKRDALELARDHLLAARKVIEVADEVERASSLLSTPEEWREAIGRYRAARLEYDIAIKAKP